MGKRYYWIKLPKTYFEDLSQKKMRKADNGILYQLIYIKLMLLSCDTEGCIDYINVYGDISEEIADEINEDIKTVQNALKYFEDNGLITYKEKDIFIPQATYMVGAECDSASRVRKHREKQALQCNNETLQSNINVTKCNTEKEKDSIYIIEDAERNDNPSFLPPTLSEVKAYCEEQNLRVNPKKFIDYYTMNGWKKKNNIPVTDWKATIQSWEQNEKKDTKSNEQKKDELLDEIEQIALRGKKI